MDFKFKEKFNPLYFLIAINVIIFLLVSLVRIKGFDITFFYLFGGEITSKIFSGDIWLLVTSTFFHIDIFHFGLNMIALWKLGEVIMTYYDGRKLFLTYIFGGICGSLLSYFTSLPMFLINDSNNMLSLGASGSIFALVGLLLGGTLRRDRFGVGLPFKSIDIVIFALPSIVLGLTPGLHINNWAHLGGLIFGIIIGLIIMPIGNIESKGRKLFINILYYLSIIIFGLSYFFLLFNAYKLFQY